MLTGVRELMQRGEGFAFETTLATKSYASLIREAKALGYQVTLLYFWLTTLYVALDRVKNRVRLGGHFILLRPYLQRGILVEKQMFPMKFFGTKLRPNGNESRYSEY